MLKYKCNLCGNKVIIEPISRDIQLLLEKIESKNLLSPTDAGIILELAGQDSAVTAREIAEELDMSSQSIGQKNKMPDGKKGLINRNRPLTGPLIYELTEFVKKIYRV